MALTKTRVNYYWEDGGYAAATGDTTAKVPGGDAQLTTAEARRNGQRVFLPASKRSVQFVDGRVEGSWALEWTLTNAWWARALLGSPTTVDNADGTWTHTYNGEPDSFQIVEGYETSTTAERTLLGCVAVRFGIDPTVDDAVARCVMEGFYADESYAETSLTAQATLDENALGYKDATLNVGGSAEAVVQDASLELAWGTGPVMAFASNKPTDFLVGSFTPSVTYSKVKQDTAALNDVYGGSTSMQETASTAAFQLDFDNDLAAGSGKNRILFDNSVSYPDRYDEDGVGDPEALIIENLDRLLQDCEIKATNETSSPP